MMDREKIADVLREYDIDVDEIDLPLSGDSAEALKKLIAVRTFKDKPELLKFLAAAYVKNNMGSEIRGDKAPPESRVLDIIKKNGIDRDLSDTEKKKLLALLAVGLIAVHRYMTTKGKARARPA